MRRLGIILGLALALATGYALGQSGVITTTLTGNEVVVCAIGGPGGPSIFCPVAELRNATALRTFVGLTGAQTYQALNTDSTLYWVGTAPTTWTITTPTTPWDGEILQIATDTTLTTLVTLTAASGQTLDTTFTNQTISAKTSVEWQFQASTSKWFQMR